MEKRQETDKKQFNIIFAQIFNKFNPTIERSLNFNPKGQKHLLFFYKKRTKRDTGERCKKKIYCPNPLYYNKRKLFQSLQLNGRAEYC